LLGRDLRRAAGGGQAKEQQQPCAADLVLSSHLRASGSSRIETPMIVDCSRGGQAT